MAKEIAIEVKDVTKIYHLFDRKLNRLKEAINPYGKRYSKDFYALNNISFTINKGEIVGIIGKNGSGKSTLLKILTGVLTPTSGSYNVKGKVSALLELGTGFNPEMTGFENIFMNGTIMGFSKEEMAGKVDSILKFADIGDFIYQPVKNYSSGMFVRLAFAVAVNIQPDILIVDEALAVGDMQFQLKCMAYMKELFNSGATVLIVSHDLGSIKSLCTKAIYMDHGNLVKMGEAADVVDYYATICREEMSNLEGKSTQPQVLVDDICEIDDNGQQRTYHSKLSFEKKAEEFRQGSGEARFANVEILDKKTVRPVRIVEFNQEIIIRMHINVLQDCSFGVNYQIRDNKNLEILGSSTSKEHVGEFNCKKNEQFVVDFITRVPLVQGNYNVLTVISKETIKNRAAKFYDIVQNVVYFDVLENAECRIWSKVYIDNKIEIHK